MEKNISAYNLIRDTYKRDDREVINYYSKALYSEEFYRMVDCVAGYLYADGVREGDKVALCLPNMPQAIIAFYAINKLGAVANIIHPLVPPMGLEKILSDIPCKSIFISDVFYGKFKKLLGRMDIGVIICALGDYMPLYLKPFYKAVLALKNIFAGKGRAVSFTRIIKSGLTADTADTDGESIAALLHSGGTTGEPKTVALSNRALNHCAENISAVFGGNAKAGESMLMILPLFHVFGLGVCMHATIAAGGRAIMLPYFKADIACKVSKKQRVTYMTGVPNMYDKMLASKHFYGEYIKDIKCCYCGGDKLPEKLKARFDAVMEKYGSVCRLSEGYGLTEATICTVNVPDGARKGSVGRAIGGISVIVMNGDKVARSGEIGEICVGGGSVMSGYYNDEETTDKVIFSLNGEQYVRTGDIGRLDEDGYLYFIDRAKRMAKISGINVFPSEIESVVRECFDEVKQCAAIEVFSRGKPHIKLYLTMADGVRYSEALEERIKRAIGDRLMRYSVPREFEVRDNLPLTQIGKVDYRKLMEEEGLINPVKKL